MTVNASIDNATHPVYATSAHGIITWFGVTTTVSFTGTTFYLLLMVSIASQNQLRRGSGVLIVHLLAVECCMVTVHYPITNTATFIAQYYQDPTLLRSINCALVQFFMTTFQHVGNWSSFFLSINRFVAVLFPLSYSKMASKFVIVGMVVASWAISLACNVPLLLGVGGQIGRTLTGDCGLLKTSPLDYIFRSSFAYYIPLFTMILLYFTLFIRSTCLKWPSRVAVRNLTTTEIMRRKRRLDVAKMLFASSVFYCCCYFPAPIMVQFFPLYTFAHRSAFIYIRLLVVCGYACAPVSIDYRL